MTVRERRPPPHSGWREQASPLLDTIASSAWVSGPVRVISALELAESPRTGESVPQWHVSITDRGRRPKPHHVRRTLRAFGMVRAEEDNHHPGYARHFWMPVDPDHRVSCECKESEQNIVDPDGYRWTNPYGVEECRGCAFERLTGKPCRLHTGASGV